MKYAVLTTVLLVSAAGLGALGQDESDVRVFANWIVENQSDLAKYRWTERLATEVGGAPSMLQLFRVSLDGEGVLRRRPLGTEIEQRAPDGPLTRRIKFAGNPRASNKLPVDLTRRVESYTHMQPGRAQAVFARAALVSDSRTPPADQDDSAPDSDRSASSDPEVVESRDDRKHLRVVDALKPGDQLDFWVDRETLRLRRMVVLTTLEEIAITITAEFTDLPDGPTFPARSMVETTSNGKPLLLQAQSFDFVRRGR